MFSDYQNSIVLLQDKFDLGAFNVCVCVFVFAWASCVSVEVPLLI